MNSYQFSNILGAPYNGGEIIFSNDDNCLISSIGSRINIYNLILHRSQTLSIECNNKIRNICMSPDDSIIICADMDNFINIINYSKGILLHKFRCPGEITCIKYSHNGKYIAASIDRGLYIWESPDMKRGWQVILKRQYIVHSGYINSIDWSKDDLYIVTSSNDMTVRLFSRENMKDFDTLAFVDHRYPVISAYFTKSMDSIISMSTEGVFIKWKFLDSKKNEKIKENSGKLILPRQLYNKKMINSKNLKLNLSKFSKGKWIQEYKYYVYQTNNSKISSCKFHIELNLLVTATTNGIFSIYDINDIENMNIKLNEYKDIDKDKNNDIKKLNNLYTFCISNSIIDSVTLNKRGDWLAIGSKENGQIIVWEWQSESYILKQQGHHFGINCVAFGPAGIINDKSQKREIYNNSFGFQSKNIIATGGIDGKLKLWDSNTGYNFQTFIEHTASITGIIFTPQGNAIISSSLDGSVRAFDIIRYRNFRTFISNKKGIQFSCVSIDKLGEIVVAGCQGSEYSIYIWNLRNGKILDILSGHTSTIVNIAFSPSLSSPGILASASWDGTTHIWDIYGRLGKSSVGESLIHTTNVLSLAFDPRGNNKMATSTLSGNITFWDIDKGLVEGSIEGLRDIHSGRRKIHKSCINHKIDNERGNLLLKNFDINKNQYFNSICYTSNGRYLLASSRNSPRVCLYDVTTYSLINCIELTSSKYLYGISVELNSKYNNDYITKFDYKKINDINSINQHNLTLKRIRQHNELPGTNLGEGAVSKLENDFIVFSICFSYDSKQWAAATNIGLFLFTLDIFGTGYSGITNHLNFSDSFKRQILTKQVNIENINLALLNKEYSKAMILSLALNDFSIIFNTYKQIPISDIYFVIKFIAPFLLLPLLNFLRICTTPGNINIIYIELHLIWLKSIIKNHGITLFNKQDQEYYYYKKDNFIENIQIKQNNIFLGNPELSDINTIFLMLLRNISQIFSLVKQVYDSNCVIMKYFTIRKRYTNFNLKINKFILNN
ncbi:hypothetical protein cand_026920 [Cryptosporidium andersoni]|uniref:Uncharacterized protein n=1 Tax=Cryptosporidium andersoni TaxID=117008 RepID=A0A1J4MRW1_9CRYT|nr:hypothetical protein cand_026920 [Cryptosporidium andersoni]